MSDNPNDQDEPFDFDAWDAARPRATDQLKVEVQELEPFPAGSNPFWHDLSNMGTDLPRNLMIMHEGFLSQDQKDLVHQYLYLVNPTTGQRIRLNISKK